MSASEKHLSPEEIDRLVQSRPSDASNPRLSDPFEELRHHLASCPACQTLVSMSQDFDRQLGALKDASATGPTPDCPAEDELRQFVVGTLAPARTDELTDHVTTCGYCALLVRQAAEDLDGESEAEEMLMASQLKSADPAWQLQLAHKIAGSTRSTGERLSRKHLVSHALPKRVSSVPSWLYAAASIVIVLAVAFTFVLMRKPSVDRLLAQAYTEQRPMDLRIAGAAPAPIRQQRGTSGSSLSRPASLLEADLQIKRELQFSPNDTKWLTAQGRSELLEWRYDEAIKSFNRALEIDPSNPDVLRDLATAHFQRAEAERRPIDYGTAIDELSQVLAKRPNDSVALFNRAIVFEKMFLYEDALRDWEEFLKEDPSGAWAPEARQHLKTLKDLLHRSHQLQQVPSDDAATAIPILNSRLHDWRAAQPLLDAADEEYLDIAITHWLADLAQKPDLGSSLRVSAPYQALRMLSTIFEEHHRDHSVADILTSASNPGFPRAAAMLSASVSSDARGEPVLAYEQAKDATRLFEAIGNRAGALRAQIEAVYALQRSLRSGLCLSSAQEIARRVDEVSYPWIKARILEEESACAAGSEDFLAAQKSAIRAGEIARQHGFSNLELRALALLSDLALDKGDTEMSWEVDRQGLTRYWGGSYPYLRAYVFYADLGYAAESDRHWYVATELWKEAVPLISETQNRSTEALARYRLATNETASNKIAEAQAELQRVSAIFSSLPQNLATRNYRVTSEVSLASIELTLGNSDSAQRRLHDIALDLNGVTQYQTILEYFTTLASAQAHTGDWKSAENNLRVAVAIGELGARTLRTDRDRLNWEQLTDTSYRELIQLYLLQPGRNEEALRVWESHRSSLAAIQPVSRPIVTPVKINFGALAANAPSPEERNIAQILPALTHVTLLTYLQLGDRLAIWAYDDRGIIFRQVSIPVGDLDVVSKRFARLCADPGSDASTLNRDARQLYGWLIAPVQTALSPDRTLWIEPDGAVSFVPFQALIDSDGNYLSKHFGVAFRSGAAASLDSQPKVTAADRVLLVGASTSAPHGSEELDPLPDVEHEIRSIAGRFRNPQLVIDRQLDRSSRDADLLRTAVFHYAGHYQKGRQPNDSPSDPLAFASGNAWLTDLPPGELSRCKLVVLSACATGFSDRLGLFDPDGPVRPFLHSGARMVIASRWNVDSKTTAELMDKFYSVLLAGSSPTAALREASLALEARPESRHPYFWAAFEVFAQN